MIHLKRTYSFSYETTRVRMCSWKGSCLTLPPNGYLGLLLCQEWKPFTNLQNIPLVSSCLVQVVAPPSGISSSAEHVWFSKHVRPSAFNSHPPFVHLHLKLPGVFSQKSPHPPLFTAHSLISKIWILFMNRSIPNWVKSTETILFYFVEIDVYSSTYLHIHPEIPFGILVYIGINQQTDRVTPLECMYLVGMVCKTGNLHRACTCWVDRLKSLRYSINKLYYSWKYYLFFAKMVNIIGYRLFCTDIRIRIEDTYQHKQANVLSNHEVCMSWI